MSYGGKEKQKDNEQFPKIMTREDTQELISLIETLNRNAEPKDKIGLNLQYRQVKIPANIYNSLKNRKNESLKLLEKEKIDSIQSTYEDNKSKEEQFNRGKLLEIENINKKLKKLNAEEAELARDYDSIMNNINRIKYKTYILRSEKEESYKFIVKNENEEKKLKEELNNLQSKYDEKIKKQQIYKDLDEYIERNNKIKNDENKLKELLCYKCKKKLRKIYYSGCKHLALCKECYSTDKMYEKKCPICFKISELVIKILDANKNY